MTWTDLEHIARWPVLFVYFGLLGVLAGYGLHRWYLLALYTRYSRRRIEPSGRLDPLPVLTVQLPVYNERYVVRRLVDAVCGLDYPRDLLQIQVLDDSTDCTSEVVQELVERRRAEGFDIEHLRRGTRSGYKAGALAAGLARARGELVAIFDADFVPPADFARRLVHHFSDPGVGMVQSRWGHLNKEHSSLTEVQSILLDGHFVIEHTARNRSGRFFNFNGTAGVWRKSCIRDAGGWSSDTLTEDLDLSYRAQLRGWRFVYVLEHVCPGELPVEMTAFKLQQYRWAKGSIQTARKLLPRILRSSLPAGVKLESVFHLSANLGYVLLFGLTLLVGPAVWLRRELSPTWLLAVDLPLFALTTFSVVAFYAVAAHEARGGLRGVVRRIPFLMAVGMGLSLNNARAVLEALAGRRSEFRRTPKYDLARGESLRDRSYGSPLGRDTWIEIVLAVYFAAVIVVAGTGGLWAAIPFLLLFEIGFAYVAGMAVAQACGRARDIPLFPSTTAADAIIEGKSGMSPRARPRGSHSPGFPPREPGWRPESR